MTAGPVEKRGARFRFTPQASGVVDWEIRF